MLDLNLNLLFTLVSSTLESIELLLKVQNIPEITVGHRDSSWLRDSTCRKYTPGVIMCHQNDFTANLLPRMTLMHSQKKRLTSRKNSTWCLRRHLAIHLMPSQPCAGAEGIEVSIRHSSLHSEKDISSYVERFSLNWTNEIAMVLDIDTDYDKGSSSSTTTTGYQFGNGILGEIFASAVFSNAL